MQVLIVGAGRMGNAIFKLLSEKRMEVRLHDTLSDVSSFYKPDAVIACVPFHACPDVALYAIDIGAHYFDLTEDIETRKTVKRISHADEDLMFVSGCGLAPGYVNTIAGRMVREARYPVKDVVMMCGAVSNPYKISWSAEGLAREYVANCEVRVEDEVINVSAFTGLHKLFSDTNWPTFEAFMTSGGAGTCPSTLKAKNVSYFTLRHVGHVESLPDAITPERLLKQFGTLQPGEEDRVYIRVKVIDEQGNEQLHLEKIMPQRGMTAIQYATAMGAVDTFNKAIRSGLKGFIRPEQL
jgi:saccharopine dehydrogenase-like NADP-dependent oxidoreductase